MNVQEIMQEMKKKASSDPALKSEILGTEKEADPRLAFCGICRRCGYEIYPIEIVDAGEEMYAAMKRSTNGGGENSPRLSWEEDPYESLLKELSEGI